MVSLGLWCKVVLTGPPFLLMDKENGMMLNGEKLLGSRIAGRTSDRIMLHICVNGERFDERGKK